MLPFIVAHAISWDSELAAYQRGEFLRLVLSASCVHARAHIVLQQWLMPRTDIHASRAGAARVFESEAAARIFIARQHPELFELPAVASAELGVLGTWGSHR